MRVFVVFILPFFIGVNALTTRRMSDRSTIIMCTNPQEPNNWGRAVLGVPLLSAALAVCTFGGIECAYADSKTRNLPPSEQSRIIASDITERQALITADFTRDIYSEDCKFQDEIDTYPIDQYVKGTKALFDADKSHVDLISDVTYMKPTLPSTDEVSNSEAQYTFRFSETLAFNVPFKPKVKLSGRVELTPGADGLIKYSREFWDQPVSDVLKTIYF
mmetsp:Transcript_17443/g.29437  ORF Transcript_17443/g.29437 Transcript_17443/m.29437 type:complete len:218 (+) Transcript_17443:160-813(+)